MDKWSLFTGGITLLAFALALWELRSKKKGASIFFLVCAIVLLFVVMVLRNGETHEYSGEPPRSEQPSSQTSVSARSDSIVQVNPSEPIPEDADFADAAHMAGAAWRLDPDFLEIIIREDNKSASSRPITPLTTAHDLRDLLEQYNFDMAKALAAHEIGRERVDECKCVPPEARGSVIRIIKAFNTAKLQERAVTEAAELYNVDPDLLDVVLRDMARSASKPITPISTARRLHEMLRRYNSDTSKTLAAYDVGPERVDDCKCVPPETREYIARITKALNHKKLANRQGRATPVKALPP